MAKSPIPIGEVFAGKYRVDRIIGEGGMGVVVAAQHLELEQPVAVKFLLDDLSQGEEGAERFRREARAAAKIQSDNVVRVLDVGTLPDNIHYMVMEFLDGQDLAAEIEEKKRIPIGLACTYLLEAIDAISHAHSVGIIHRDLKPANLFLSKRPDGSRRIKVVDFGISKTLGGSSHELTLTKTSAWIGSPLYMAPEQMQSARSVDIRADVWSLGAILYEMISGRPPYIADSLPQLCNLLLTEDPLSLAARCPEVPASLSEAVMSCLQRDPAKRFSNTAPLARALLQHASNETGSALPSEQIDSTILKSSISLDHAKTALVADSAEAGLSPELNDALRTFTGLNTPAGVTESVAVPGETQASWGGTGKGPTSGSKLLSSKALGLTGAVLALLAAAAFFATRSQQPQDAPSEISTISAANPVVTETPKLTEAATDQVDEPKPEQVEPVEQNEKPTGLEDVDKGKVPGDTEAVQVKTEIGQRASSEQPEPKKVKFQAVPKPKPKKVRAPAVPKSTKKTRAPADDLADFGGRR